MKFVGEDPERLGGFADSVDRFHRQRIGHEMGPGSALKRNDLSGLSLDPNVAVLPRENFTHRRVAVVDDDFDIVSGNVGLGFDPRQRGVSAGG